jgi:ABC-2 type transport system permease protein
LAGEFILSAHAVILAGAALNRERERGTMDHLLVMPMTLFEIAMAKVRSARVPNFIQRIFMRARS